MPVTIAQQLNEYYNEAFRCKDLERLVLLYEPQAMLAAGPGQFVRGHEEIRNRLRNLLALSGTLSSDSQSCVEFENLAMLHANWRFIGTGPDGKPVEMSGRSSKLARRQSDGAWLYIVDLPFGA